MCSTWRSSSSTRWIWCFYLPWHDLWNITTAAWSPLPLRHESWPFFTHVFGYSLQDRRAGRSSRVCDITPCSAYLYQYTDRLQHFISIKDPLNPCLLNEPTILWDSEHTLFVMAIRYSVQRGAQMPAVESPVPLATKHCAPRYKACFVLELVFFRTPSWLERLVNLGYEEVASVLQNITEKKKTAPLACFCPLAFKCSRSRAGTLIIVRYSGNVRTRFFTRALTL